MSLAALGGSVVDNSYLSLAEGDAIALTMLGTLKWLDTATTDAQKENALIQATLQLDTLDWIGTRASSAQSLGWPRDGAKCGEKSYDNATIPREIELATFDLAEGLLNSPGLITGIGVSAGGGGTPGELVPGVPNRDLRRLRLDVIELEWRDQATSSGITLKTPLSVMPHLAAILGCLTTSSVPAGRSRMVPVIRG